MKHDCQPNPIDTDYMVLVHDMVRLSEQIARQVSGDYQRLAYIINDY